MNISWLEQYWRGSEQKKQMDYLDYSLLARRKNDLQRMSVGVKTVRLPICFDRWEDRIPPFTIDSMNYFKVIDSMIQWTGELNMNLIIDYQHGNLRTQKIQQDTTRFFALWDQIAHYFSNTDPERIFLEPFNEPHNIDDALWWQIAEKVVKVIRKHCPNHTIFLGGADYNNLSSLLRSKPIKDDNIIYTIHYYEPLIFTHQGTPWLGAPTSTIGIQFEANGAEEVLPSLAPGAKGTWGENKLYTYPEWKDTTTVHKDLKKAAIWRSLFNVPVYCGEFGSYRAGNVESRSKHLKRIRLALEQHKINYAWWEWDGNFSFMTNGKIPLMVQEAWGYKPAIPAPSLWKFNIKEINTGLLFEQLTAYASGSIFLENMDNNKRFASYKIINGKCTISKNGIPFELIKISIWDADNRLRGTHTWDRRK